MVCLDDDDLADRCLLAASLGSALGGAALRLAQGTGSRFFSSIDDDLEYDNLFIFDEVGWNFEPSELSAAFGLVQLDKLDDNLARRKRNFARLHSRTSHSGPTSSPCLRTTAELDTAWHMFPVIDPARIGVGAPSSSSTWSATASTPAWCGPATPPASRPSETSPSASRPRPPQRRPGHGAGPGAALEPRSGRRRHRLHLGRPRGVPVVSERKSSADHLVIISADGHAGGNHEQYREYLESEYLDQFDAWRAAVLEPVQGPHRRHAGPELGRRRRIAELEADGVVAEVIFPNTIPPFFPTGAVVARPPTPDGLRAAARRHPGPQPLAGRLVRGHADRRAGIGQIFLNDLDDAIADVRWCHEHGLRGGVLVRPVPDDMKHLKPLYAPDYDPLWAVCEDLGVVVNTHSGGGGMPDYGPYPAARAPVVGRERRSSPAARSCHMIVGGVFERFPRLRFVLTEQGASWIRPMLAQLDSYHGQMKRPGRIGELKYDAGPDAAPAAERVFRTELLGRCQLPVARRRPRLATTSAWTGSCGGATIPTTNRPIPIPGKDFGAPSPAPTGRAAADPRERRRPSTDSTSTPSTYRRPGRPHLRRAFGPLRGHARGEPISRFHPG